MTLKLDEFTLLCLREGRYEGKKNPSVWLPEADWMDLVRRLIGKEVMSEVFLGIWWRKAYESNFSPVEAILRMHHGQCEVDALFDRALVAMVPIAAEEPTNDQA